MMAIGTSLISFALLAMSTSLQEGEGAQAPADILAQAPQSDWVMIDPENLLVMELPSGPITIELRPDMAPQHVERIKTLTREGFYDGLLFHRVIEGFMAQGGDPTATGTGSSDLPDLPGEFVKPLEETANLHIVGRDDRAAQIGFIGTVAVATQAPTLNRFLTQAKPLSWGLHCQGVMSMARANNPNSANSQFFLMFGDSRRNLDQGYTVWGKIVDGYRNARRINRGEPPPRPTPIVRMRVMADIPEADQKTVEYLDTASPRFTDYLKATRAMTDDGFFPDTCAVNVPIRMNGELPE